MLRAVAWCHVAAAFIVPAPFGRPVAPRPGLRPLALRAHEARSAAPTPATREGPGLRTAALVFLAGALARRGKVAAAAVGVAPAPDASESTVGVERIRNFCIIAHIDHGKSTLADRLLEVTKTVERREMQAQLLDSMDIERERGITIKLNSARMRYTATDGETYILNLIDTPGHVDFSYEVSRSLAACEGALLVVDAAQGVQAQTLANVYLALDADLEIVPVLNKIDLPAADPDRVSEEIESTIGLDCSDAIHASAKSGIGIEDVLEAVVKRVPSPPAATGGPLRALIYDSIFDSYRGVVVYFRVVDGALRKGDTVRFMASGKEYEVTEIGVMEPKQRPVQALHAGEVGYMCAAIKEIGDARVGDTMTLARAKEAVEPLAGYSEPTPMVYCGLFPTEGDKYQALRDALGKLELNDAALTYEAEASVAMGFGFRCGFLGLLHMEIVQERLEREFDLDLVTTSPSVVYKVLPSGCTDLSDPRVLTVETPARMPDYDKGCTVMEPICRMELITPSEYSGTLLELGQDRRGIFKDMKYLTPTRTSIVFELPLSEVITDFFDVVKSRTKGYASVEYSFLEYREADLVRLDIRINGDLAPPLATVVHRDVSNRVGKALAIRLKELIPRQQFKVPIQACIGVKVVASTQISAMRKDVLAKCYGGDISRKKKLLQKQAKGKKRMKAIGKVNVPQEAFMAVLSIKAEGN